LIQGDTVVYSKKYKYAGAADAIGRLKDGGKLVIVDWKTSNSLHNEYALQLSAYAKALEEMEGEKVHECWVVRLDKKAVAFETMKIRNIDECFAGFLAALRLWRAVKDPLLLPYKAMLVEATDNKE